MKKKRASDTPRRRHATNEQARLSEFVETKIAADRLSRNRWHYLEKRLASVGDFGRLLGNESMKDNSAFRRNKVF